MLGSNAPDLQTRLSTALEGQYTIERPLGQGGMGTVFLARDNSLDRQVAIKVIAPEVAASPELRQRFIQEARTVAKLRHPNIVAVYAAGEADGLLYFAMEFVPGESLRDRMTRESPMSSEDGLPVLRDLALALDYAHSAGIVHRDVKPENVLLDRDTGRAMLTDFGVARALSAGDGRLTGTGFVLGSPKYMSPEQASGDSNLDGRSDIYSLGLVGYELFSGEPAVHADTAASLLVKHLTERPAPLSEKADVAPEVAAAIDRTLEKDPAQRFQRAAAFAAALSGEDFTDATPAWQVGRTTTGNTAKRRASKSKSRIALFAAPVVAIIALAAVLFAGRGGVNERAWLVAPFEVQGSDQSLNWLREGSLNMLTTSLAQWQDLHVVEYERTLDLLREEKLEDEARVGLEAAQSMARKVDAGRVVMGQIQTGTDSIVVIARLYDVKSGKSLESAQASSIKGVDPRPLFDQVASDLLNLVGAPRVTVNLAEQTTRSVSAYRDYLEGLRHLNSFRLRAADSAFDRAIESDSTFALAYYKKALGMGWNNLYDSVRMHASEMSVEHSQRLSPRQQELVRGHHELTLGFFAQQRGDTLGTIRSFVAARERLAKLVATDSTDAEAHYALADADYHLVFGTRLYGSSADSAAKYLTESLRGFKRTIELDPSFHLAYQHLVEMYQVTSQQNALVVLIGDTIKSAMDPSLAKNFDRVAKHRSDSRNLAKEAAAGWVTIDPDAINARRTLALILANFGQPDSAATVLRDAMKRPTTSDASLEMQIPFMLLKAGDSAAGSETKRILTKYNLDSLKRMTAAVRVTGLLSAMTVGTASGMISVIDSVSSTLQQTDTIFPGSDRTPTREFLPWIVAALKVGTGMEVTPSMRNDLVTGIRTLERNHGGGDFAVPYIAFLETGDTTFLNTAVKWASPNAGLRGLPELRAYASLLKGDSMSALAYIREPYPTVDSLKKGSFSMNGTRVAVRASVLAQLGRTADALALYETLEPVRFASQSSLEYGWAIYVRSFAARAKLYEEQGDRDKAIAAYERFIELWSNAEAPLQPQVSDAKRELARLKDLTSSVKVNKG